MKALKITAVVSIILMFASCGKAQDEMESSEVPEPVKKAFKEEKTKMNDVEWEKEGDYFAAEFKKKGVEKAVVYDAKGNVIRTETGINTGSLMPSIKQYLEENYSDYEIEESEKIEKKGKTSFEVEVEANDEEVELLFNSEGQFIKEEKEKEEDDEDEEKENEKGDDENEKEISTNALPQIIKDKIAEKYPDAELLEADEVTKKEGSIMYDVEIKTKEGIIEVMYDAEGNFLGVESEDEEQEN